VKTEALVMVINLPRCSYDIRTVEDCY